MYVRQYETEQAKNEIKSVDPTWSEMEGKKFLWIFMEVAKQKNKNARVSDGHVNNAFAFKTFTLPSKALFPCCEIRQPPIPSLTPIIKVFFLLFDPFRVFVIF